MIATKPLNPESIKSHFCINEYVNKLYKEAFLIISQNEFCGVDTTCLKKAKRIFRNRYPNEKILIVKKFKRI